VLQSGCDKANCIWCGFKDQPHALHPLPQRGAPRHTHTHIFLSSRRLTSSSGNTSLFLPLEILFSFVSALLILILFARVVCVGSLRGATCYTSEHSQPWNVVRFIRDIQKHRFVPDHSLQPQSNLLKELKPNNKGRQEIQGINHLEPRRKQLGITLYVCMTW
jgi:hypothetical protein